MTCRPQTSLSLSLSSFSYWHQPLFFFHSPFTPRWLAARQYTRDDQKRIPPVVLMMCHGAVPSRRRQRQRHPLTLANAGRDKCKVVDQMLSPYYSFMLSFIASRLGPTSMFQPLFLCAPLSECVYPFIYIYIYIRKRGSVAPAFFASVPGLLFSSFSFILYSFVSFFSIYSARVCMYVCVWVYE